MAVMPLLEITPEMQAEPSELGLDYVRSVMLFDQPLRDKWLGAMTTVRTVTDVRRVPAARRLLDLDREVFEAGAALAGFEERYRLAFRNGCFAGELLACAIQEARHGKVNFGAVKQKLVARNRRIAAQPRPPGVPSYKVDTKAVQAIWTAYRPTSHLWAAFVTEAFGLSGFSDLLPDSNFPCALGRLDDFLARADLFARDGMSIKIGRTVPLLKPGELWRLPDGFVLPYGYQLIDQA